MVRLRKQEILKVRAFEQLPPLFFACTPQQALSTTILTHVGIYQAQVSLWRVSTRHHLSLHFGVQVSRVGEVTLDSGGTKTVCLLPQ